MNDCLITKLKGSVSDATLPYLNGIKINLSANQNQIINVRALSGQKVTMKLHNVSIIYNGNTYTDSFLLPFSSAGELELNVITGNVEGCIDMIPNYSLRDYKSNNTQGLYVGTFDIEKFKYCQSLISVGFKNTYCSGSVEEAFAGKTELYNICVFGPDVYGDLAKAFGAAVKLTGLDMYRTSISGTMESLVAAQRAAGRTTGMIKFGYLSSVTPVTFNGAEVYIGTSTASEDMYLTWDETTITFLGTTITA